MFAIEMLATIVEGPQRAPKALDSREACTWCGQYIERGETAQYEIKPPTARGRVAHPECCAKARREAAKVATVVPDFTATIERKKAESEAERICRSLEAAIARM